MVSLITEHAHRLPEHILHVEHLHQYNYHQRQRSGQQHLEKTEKYSYGKLRQQHHCD